MSGYPAALVRIIANTFCLVFFNNSTETSGDGHKADEGVCVRGAERVKAGTSTAEPA